MLFSVMVVEIHLVLDFFGYWYLIFLDDTAIISATTVSHTRSSQLNIAKRYLLESGFDHSKLAEGITLSGSPQRGERQ